MCAIFHILYIFTVWILPYFTINFHYHMPLQQVNGNSLLMIVLLIAGAVLQYFSITVLCLLHSFPVICVQKFL